MVEPRTARAAMSCAPAHEIKFTSLDLKAVEVDGSFEGYASLFHKEDMSHDVVLPGAFAESLRAAGPAASRCCSSTTPTSRSACGRLKEDARGLYAQGPPDAGGRKSARGARADARRRARRAVDRLSHRERPARPRSRRAPAGEGRSVGDLGCDVSAASRSARRQHEGARLCRRDGTRFRTLAHAGRWAHAQGGARSDERGL